MSKLPRIIVFISERAAQECVWAAAESPLTHSNLLFLPLTLPQQEVMTQQKLHTDILFFSDYCTTLWADM